MKKLQLTTTLLLLGSITTSHSIQLAPGGSVNVKSARAIGPNSDPKNTLTKTDTSKLSDTDSAFDNSPPKSRGDPSEIVFPPDDETPTKNQTTRPQQIPLKVLLGLGLGGTEIDTEKFFDKYVGNVKLAKNDTTQETWLTDPSGVALRNQKNERIIIKKGYETRIYSPRERTSINQGLPMPSLRSGPSPDMSVRTLNKQSDSEQICIPEMKSIPAPIVVEPYLLTIPKCIRVERCGGCCLSDKLECQPNSIENKTFEIQKFSFNGDVNGNKPLRLEGSEIVTVEKHNSCRCECKKRAEHCNRYQEYNESECDCVCRNKVEQVECSFHEDKIWDQDSCMCICREIKDCSSGDYYDLNTCSCQDVKRNSKYQARKARGL